MNPQAAIDAVFAAFGRSAVLMAPGPRQVLAIVRAPDEIERIGQRPVLVGSLALELRACDMAGVRAGTRIYIDGRMRVVRGEPEYRDADRLVAHLDTQPETA